MPLDIDRLVRSGFIAPDFYRRGSLVWKNVNTGEETGSAGYLTDTTVSEGRFDLSYCLGSEHRPIKCPIRLETSRPHFGGVRWWFVCPLSRQRVRKLYLHQDCDYFGSRAALGLTYQSCREGVGPRAQRKADKLWRKLGPEGERPKGMHWQTYDRIGGAAEAAESASWGAFLYRCANMLGLAL